jgi:glycosyltransferase involved in cell wall biosynthesis
LTDGIVMVTNAVMPDQLGGLQRYVGELSGALGRCGIPVTVLTKRTSPEYPKSEALQSGVWIRRYAIPERSTPWYAAGYPAATVAGIARALRQLPGLVHVHYPLQGAVVCASSRPYVHTFHAPIYKEIVPERRYPLIRPLEGPLVGLTRRVEQAVGRRAGATVVLSEFMRTELARLAPEAANSASLVPAGINTDFFAPGRGIEHPFARDRWPLLFTARRLVPRTGISELIQAMPAVLEAQPNAALAVAGDGQLRIELERLVGDLGLGDHVRLLGHVSEHDLRDWYRAATLFVLPTQELEGFGMSTVEALACGTLALGTPAGGTPEVLGTLDSRLVADGTTAESIARGILSLVADRTMLERLTKRARGHVVPAMSWSTIADRHLEIYERVLAVGRR